MKTPSEAADLPRVDGLLHSATGSKNRRWLMTPSVTPGFLAAASIASPVREARGHRLRPAHAPRPRGADRRLRVQRVRRPMITASTPPSRASRRVRDPAAVLRGEPAAAGAASQQATTLASGIARRRRVDRAHLPATHKPDAGFQKKVSPQRHKDHTKTQRRRRSVFEDKRPIL